MNVFQSKGTYIFLKDQMLEYNQQIVHFFYRFCFKFVIEISMKEDTIVLTIK